MCIGCNNATHLHQFIVNFGNVGILGIFGPPTPPSQVKSNHTFKIISESLTGINSGNAASCQIWSTRRFENDPLPLTIEVEQNKITSNFPKNSFRSISTRIYEIPMNSYESSIIYGVLGQHLMTHRFQSQTYIKGCFNVLKIQSNQ